MSPRLLVACLILLVAAANADPGSREPLGVPHAVSAYSRALDSLERGGRHPSLEHVYRLGMLVRDSLYLSGNPSTLIDSLDEGVFSTVRHAMRGFWVYRDPNGNLVEPDPAFFLHLARLRGGPADTAYFGAFALLYDAGWPRYMHQVTDESGCIDYGTGQLVKAYGIWSGFQARYPDRYSPWAGNELENVERELTAGDCACGDSASVIRELRLFGRLYPRSSLSSSVKGQLEGIQAGSVSMRYHCIPS